MNPVYEKIIDGEEILFNGELLQLKVGHLLDLKDEDEKYTGCYLASFKNGMTLNVELNAENIWIERGKGPSDLARAIGNLIESYSE